VVHPDAPPLASGRPVRVALCSIPCRGIARWSAMAPHADGSADLLARHRRRDDAHTRSVPPWDRLAPCGQRTRCRAGACARATRRHAIHRDTALTREDESELGRLPHRCHNGGANLWGRCVHGNPRRGAEAGRDDGGRMVDFPTKAPRELGFLGRGGGVDLRHASCHERLGRRSDPWENVPLPVVRPFGGTRGVWVASPLHLGASALAVSGPAGLAPSGAVGRRTR
jgi:hypothetical protein